MLQVEWNDFAPKMYDMGFERGWGRDAAKTKEQVKLLLDILQVREDRGKGGGSSRYGWVG
jgi:hypothetical protein